MQLAFGVRDGRRVGMRADAAVPILGPNQATGQYHGFKRLFFPTAAA